MAPSPSPVSHKPHFRFSSHFSHERRASMTTPNILIVEDASIVALDLKNRLTKLGYAVCDTVATGEEAVQVARETKPKLVLMDIKLKGKMDGVEAAAQIQEELDVPVIYLTAYADSTTLERAKITEPFGYLVKPFEEKELTATIEMALYKHRMERRLRENEQWLKVVLHSIGEAVIATDTKGRVRFMNPVAEQLTGWPQGEALKQPLRQIFLATDEQSGQPIPDPTVAVLQQKKAVGPHTCLLTPRGGHAFPIRCHATPITNERGNLFGVVLVFQDIRAEREMQSRMQEQERLAVVGQLAAGIAHDFNNILTSIIGFADLLRSNPDLPAGASVELGYIIEQGQRAAHLIRQILDFSRQSVSHKQPLEMVAFLKETLALLKRTLPENIRLSLNVTPSQEAYTFEGDPAQLQQVLTNLALNARDAMPEGGLLRFSISSCQVESYTPPPLPDMKPGSYIILAVSDTGNGIPPEVLPHVFEPFFTTKEVGQGTGLGLAQVYGIVKQHDGYIQATSREGEGATFTLYFPATFSTTNANGAHAEVSEVPRGNREVILLVEDDPAVLQVEMYLLEYLNYEVLVALNGRHALEMYNRHHDKIALVLTDVTMPEMDGLELVEALYEKKAPVGMVAVSGYPLTAQDKEILSRYEVLWLEKPLNLRKLAHTLQESLAKASRSPAD
ncbi:MAG: response regulator [Caldilineae bacterium]|nr:MAG: response regulator [Caldilineae bacterium]